MARPMEISDAEVAKLKEAGLNAVQIAEQLKVSRPSVYRSLKRLAKVRPYMRHDEAFPWTITPEHQKSVVSNYIRALHRAAKTGDGDMRMLRAAFNWANGLIDDGHDIDYDRGHTGTEVCPQGGYRLVDEDPAGGWLRRLRDEAEEGPSPE